MGLKGAALLVGALLGLGYGGLEAKGLLYALVGGVVFFFLPDLLIYNLGLKRQEETSRSLADAPRLPESFERGTEREDVFLALVP